MSRTDSAHLYRMSLRPSQLGSDRGDQQARFTAGRRHNMLCVVASVDSRNDSLRIHQDATVCSATFDPGYHLVHQLAPGRSAWLHLVFGEATLGDTVLSTGDGVGMTSEPSVSLTARESTEILLLDLGPGGRLGARVPLSVA